MSFLTPLPAFITSQKEKNQSNKINLTLTLPHPTLKFAHISRSSRQNQDTSSNSHCPILAPQIQMEDVKMETQNYKLS